jgi:hypothetical protein
VLTWSQLKQKLTWEWLFLQKNKNVILMLLSKLKKILIKGFMFFFMNKRLHVVQSSWAPKKFFCFFIIKIYFLLQNVFFYDLLDSSTCEKCSFTPLELINKWETQKRSTPHMQKVNDRLFLEEQLLGSTTFIFSPNCVKNTFQFFYWEIIFWH